MSRIITNTVTVGKAAKLSINFKDLPPMSLSFNVTSLAGVRQNNRVWSGIGHIALLPSYTFDIPMDVLYIPTSGERIIQIDGEALSMHIGEAYDIPVDDITSFYISLDCHVNLETRFVEEEAACE